MQRARKSKPKRRFWTKFEIKKIKRLRLQGHEAATIAKELRRTEMAIRQKLFGLRIVISPRCANIRQGAEQSVAA